MGKPNEEAGVWIRFNPLTGAGVRNCDVADFVIPKFHDVLGDVMAHGHTHYWLHGG